MQGPSKFSAIKQEMLNSRLPSDQELLISFYGPTGSGKSTLENYILGNEMTYEKKGGDYLIYPKESSHKGPKIGNQNTSETRHCSVYEWKSGISLMDLPGPKDTFGLNNRIFNAWVTKNSLRKGMRVKFLLVVSIADVRSGKGVEFLKEYVSGFSQLIHRQFPNVISSISLVVTKVSSEYEPDDIYEIIQSMLNTNKSLLPNQHVIDMMQELIDKKRIMVFYQPNHPQFQHCIEVIKENAHSMPSYTMVFDGNISLDQETIHCLENMKVCTLQSVENVKKQFLVSFNQTTQYYSNSNSIDLMEAYLSQIANARAQLKNNLTTYENTARILKLSMNFDSLKVQIEEIEEELQFLQALTNQSCDNNLSEKLEEILAVEYGQLKNKRDHLVHIQNIERMQKEHEEKLKKQEEARNLQIEKQRQEREEQQKIRENQRLQELEELRLKNEREEAERSAELKRQTERLQQIEQERRRQEQQAARIRAQKTTEQKIVRQVERIGKQAETVTKNIVKETGKFFKKFRF